MRSDLVLGLVKSVAERNTELIKQHIQALATEERHKGHDRSANTLEHYLLPGHSEFVDVNTSSVKGLVNVGNSTKKLEDLVLCRNILCTLDSFLEEQEQRDLLLTYGMLPRNRMLFVGPPGNGKTSFANVIAKILNIPLFSVSYSGLIGSYLGQTGSNLNKVFEFIAQTKCVFLIDELDAIAKERSDVHESGEMKRSLNTLLLQMDSLPNDVIVIGATNHPKMLDAAIWRRFQVQLAFENPTDDQIIEYLTKFAKEKSISFGYDNEYFLSHLRGSCFSDLEEFTHMVYRKYILKKFKVDIKDVIDDYFTNRKQLTTMRGDGKVVC